MAIRCRTWLAVATLSILVLVAGFAALGVIHHIRGARFVATVSPISVSVPQCVDMLKSRYSPENTRITCALAAKGTWFHIVVRNTGRRLAYLQGCMVTGLDSSSQIVFSGELPVIQGQIGGKPLGAGQSASWTWFLARSVVTDIPITTAAPADHFQVRCPVIDYGRGVPG